MALTSRLKKMLIVTAALAIFAAVWTWAIVPRLFPAVACVYENQAGEISKGFGENCNSVPGAIVLTVK